MKNTKTAILDATQDLVQRQSISGVSFQELANRIGIKKGSMYYHFPTKDELTIAMLERAGEMLKVSFERGRNKTATQQLDYFLNIFCDFIGAGRKLCPGGAFAGEWDKLSFSVKKQVRNIMKIQLKGIRQILEAGIASKEFDSHGLSLEELSQWLVAIVQGALLTSRISGSKNSFNCCSKSIKQFLYRR